MKLVYQFMAIFFIFSPTSNHFHSLQVENCDSNSRLAVDEDDNAKLRLERVNTLITTMVILADQTTVIGNKWVLKQQDLKMFSLKVNKYK